MKMNQTTKCGYHIQLVAMEGDKPYGVVHLPTSQGEKLLGVKWDANGKVIEIEGHDVTDYDRLDVTCWEMDND